MHVRAALQHPAAPESVAYHNGPFLRKLALLLIFFILLHNAERKGGITLVRGQVRPRGLSPKVGSHRVLDRGALLPFGYSGLLTI